MTTITLHGAPPTALRLHAPGAAGPVRRLGVLGTIALLHVGAFWLALGHRAPDAARREAAPVEAVIIREAPPPPPPPPERPRQVVTEQRRAPAPPPLRVPQPEVAPPPVPTDAAPVAALAPVEPAPVPVPAPPAPAAPPAAPAAAPAPAFASAGVVCPNSAQVRAATRYPAAALRRSIAGDVVVEFLVAASGAIENVKVVGAAHALLAEAAVAATRQFLCEGQSQPVRVQVSYSFKLG